MSSGKQKQKMDQNEIKDVKVAVCYSDSVYRGIQSVVSFLYWQYGI